MKVYQRTRSEARLLSADAVRMPPTEGHAELPFDASASTRCMLAIDAVRLHNLDCTGLAVGRRAFASVLAEAIARMDSTRPESAILTECSGSGRLAEMFGVPIHLDPFADDDSVHALTSFDGFSATRGIRSTMQSMERRYAGE